MLLPLQILVALIFSLSNGYIQGNFGIMGSSCTALNALPPGLQTQIANPTHATDCRKSFFGFDISRVLVVSRVEEGDLTTTLSETFWLDSAGHLTDRAGYDVTWIAILVLLIYFVVLEARYGVTIGKKAIGIRVIRVAAPQISGVGLGRAIARRFAWQIGGIPYLLTQVPMFWYRYDAEALSSLVNSPVYLSASYAAMAVFAVWLAWIVISMARKRDPVYDRIIGTAVIRKRA